MPLLDVIIIGAGPAGLSAALVLGRCRRRVLVLDAGSPRNAVTRAVHGFFSRDGIAPDELLQIGREQLRQYDGVELRTAQAVDARAAAGGFEVVLQDGSRLLCRKLVLATGVVDDLPQVEGIEALYGRSVFHCPYCDGWELRDQPLAAYGRARQGQNLALELRGWSDDVVLCTDGPAGLSPEDRDRLTCHRIAIREESILRLHGQDGVLERIVFAAGPALARRALFFSTSWQQRSDLPARLGCTMTDKGSVATGKYELTCVEGLYVVGDASGAVQFVVVAVAEGAKAAYAINTALRHEEQARREGL